MGRKRKIYGPCPYCGKNKSLNRDHIFAKVLFRQMDKDMLVINVCYECNRVKSLGDRDLRNYVNMHIEGSRHPDAEYHLERMLGHEPTREWLKREMEASIDVDFVSESGIILGQGFGINFNRDRALDSLSYSIRGLYALETGEFLDCQYPVDILELDFRIAVRFMKKILRFQHDSPVIKGNDVVSYVTFPQIGDEGPESRAYLILINGGVSFFCGTGRVAEWITRFKEEREKGATEFPSLDGQAFLRLVPDEAGQYRVPPQ